MKTEHFFERSKKNKISTAYLTLLSLRRSNGYEIKE